MEIDLKMNSHDVQGSFHEQQSPTWPDSFAIPVNFKMRLILLLQ
jgi:hypothetical protein